MLVKAFALCHANRQRHHWVMDNAAQAIGVFDSGIGGLTVVRQMQRLLPHEQIIYLGDTARVPYGTKSAETVTRFACEDAAFLTEQGVKALVVACNSASASALPELGERFELPTFGVILPGAIAANEATRNGHIGVIGTQATIRSGAYERLVGELNHELRVTSCACPLLVPLVEEGWLDHAVTEAVLREYLAPMLAEGIDTLVLGCTHYPLLKETIARVAGPEVTLVDSAETCAAFVRQELQWHNLLVTEGEGGVQIHVTDEMERVRDLAGRFLGGPSDTVRQVVLGAL